MKTPRRYRLAFSIVASFTGEHPDLSDYWPCETTLSDVIRESPVDVTSSEPFDSEYSYCAREGGIPERILDRLEETSGVTRFQICRAIKKQFPREAFWACVSDIQFSGILSRKDCFAFLESVGASYEDCETMGTLGGPLGGIVPDFPFSVESQALISSIRITPILCEVMESGDFDPIRPPSESQWNAIREIFRGRDAVYEISRHARVNDA